MKITLIEWYRIRIPFTQSIDHNLKNRRFSESILVKVGSADGIVGYGEGAPRDYVNGESMEQIEIAQKFLLQSKVFPVIEEVDDIQEYCDFISAQYQLPSLVSAINIALLDWLGKQKSCNISTFFGTANFFPIQYSAILPFLPMEKLESWLSLIKDYNFKHLKVKVGLSNDMEVLAKAREILGTEIDIRVDANRSWNYEQAVERIRQMEAYNVSCVEEPLVATEIERLPQLSDCVGSAIMLDESVCNIQDARYYTKRFQPSRLMFNLKLSKSGGLLFASDLHRFATDHGVDCQLGCNVGETTILSAAGRIFAQTHRLRYLEGSYASFFMEDDIGLQKIGFHKEGRSFPIIGNGLGIEIDQNKLMIYGNHFQKSKIY